MDDYLLDTPSIAYDTTAVERRSVVYLRVGCSFKLFLTAALGVGKPWSSTLIYLALRSVLLLSYTCDLIILLYS